LKLLKNLGVLIHSKEIVIGHRLGDKLVNERVVVESIDVKILCLIPLRDIGTTKNVRTFTFIRCSIN